MRDSGNRPQRILYTQGPTGGGSTLSLLDLVRGLDARRYEPVVLFLHPNEYQKNFENLGIKVLTFNRPFRRKVPAGRSPGISNRPAGRGQWADKLRWLVSDIGTAKCVARIIKDEKISLVHQNVGFDRAVIIAAIFSGIPRVAHFRNFSRRVAGTNKLLSSRVDALIYITKAIADHYRALGIKNKRASVVYDPIDIEQFSAPPGVKNIREEFSVPQDGWLISNVGRITPWKGQDCFLLAMLKVIKAFPKTKVLIVGKPGPTETDQHFYEKLKIFIEHHQLSGNVCFTGLRHDIPALMAASDLVVHSATKPEPWGRVIAEAMVAGTPVIATAAGGVLELIKDGETGYLVPPGDESRMALAIQAFLGDKPSAERIAGEAKIEAVERYTIERHVGSIQRIYDDLLEPNTGSRH